MKHLKDYHRRKIAIIELIDECERRINNETAFKNRISAYERGNLYAIEISTRNIDRYERIKQYLTKRYNR